MNPTFDEARNLREMEEQEREDEIYRSLKDDGADTSYLITPEEMHAEVRAAARRFLDVLAEIDDPLTNMVVAEAAWRAALYAAGSAPPAGPGVRELAAEALLGAVAALRPHVPFVPVESGRRAAEALLVCCRSCGKAHRRTTE